jgi:hypothetical protein
MNYKQVMLSTLTLDIQFTLCHPDDDPTYTYKFIRITDDNNTCRVHNLVTLHRCVIFDDRLVWVEDKIRYYKQVELGTLKVEDTFTFTEPQIVDYSFGYKVVDIRLNNTVKVANLNTNDYYLVYEKDQVVWVRNEGV